MRIALLPLVLFVFMFMFAGSCRTAEPLPEVMSEAEFDSPLNALEVWRSERIAECPEDDAQCRHAVWDEYLDRVKLLWEEDIDQIEARWDASRSR